MTFTNKTVLKIFNFWNKVWIAHRPTENMFFPIEKKVANCIFGGFFKLQIPETGIFTVFFSNSFFLQKGKYFIKNTLWFPSDRPQIESIF